MYDQQVRDDVENFMNCLLRHEFLREIDRPDMFEFVLDVRYDDDSHTVAQEWFV